MEEKSESHTRSQNALVRVVRNGVGLILKQVFGWIGLGTLRLCRSPERLVGRWGQHTRPHWQTPSLRPRALAGAIFHE